MIDQEIKLAIQQEVTKQLTDTRRLNAGGMLFDPNTGMATQGKNLVGLTGNRSTHNAIRTNLTQQTIASGVITYTSCDMRIDTESAAASDDLDTINPGSLARDRDILILSAYDDSHTVVVKAGTGNIILTSDFTMDSVNDRLVIQWSASRALWIEICRTNF